MADRIISLVSEDQKAGKPRVYPLNLEKPAVPHGYPKDLLGRALHDLRISVTDRCNFRCVYCMPKSVFGKDYAFLPQKQLLTFEEIERVAQKFAELGIEKIRLTGGEPMLRKNLERLIEKLARIKTPSGKPMDLTLTTNATLLAKKAVSLKSAGLSRVTVSMDALSNDVFRKMVDVDIHVDEVLAGIDAAHSAGLGPIKINMVVKRSVNLAEIVPMARHFKGSPHILRFIEFMDVGSSNGWQMDEVVPSSDVISIISAECGKLEPADPNYRGEVAERWIYEDGAGEIGVISSVTQAFCKDCSRIRLSTEGRLYTCLFANMGHDLKPVLRQELPPEEESRMLDHAIRNLWASRGDRYSEVRTANTPQPRERIEMSYIGG